MCDVDLPCVLVYQPRTDARRKCDEILLSSTARRNALSSHDSKAHFAVRFCETNARKEFAVARDNCVAESCEEHKRVTVISGSVPNGKTDVCWVVITNDGRYVYTANFVSSTILSYRLDPSGALTLN